MSHNKINFFPWTLLLNFSFKLLKLDYNNIRQAPRSRNILLRINEILIFTIRQNNFQCTCSMNEFAYWLALRHQTLNCRSALGWLNISSTLYSSKLEKNCRKPIVDMIVAATSQSSVIRATGKSSPFSSLWESNIENFHLNVSEGSNITITCQVTANSTFDTITKLGWSKDDAGVLANIHFLSINVCFSKRNRNKTGAAC